MDARLHELIVYDMVERIDESYFVVDNNNGSCLAFQEVDDVSNCKLSRYLICFTVSLCLSGGSKAFIESEFATLENDICIHPIRSVLSAIDDALH